MYLQWNQISKRKVKAGSVLDVIAAFSHCQFTTEWIIGGSSELLVSLH